MAHEITKVTTSDVIESVVIDGDLSRLTPEQRVNYYKQVCTSLDLNPLTRPFNYITLNGKLTLYATKTATDQLRNNHNVSVDDVTINEDADSFTVIAKGHDATGRSDVEIGVVSKKDMQGNQGNAKMKAVTKAKRRLTLSLCGLGMLDETELETIPQAKPITVSVETGEMVEDAQAAQSAKDAIRNTQAKADAVIERTTPTSRPYPPETVKEAIDKKAAKHKNFVPSEAQQKLLRYGLSLCFNGEDTEDKRHTVLKYLAGTPSTKEVAGNTFKAIVEDWLKMQQKDDGSGEYEIDGMAAKEAQSIYAAALVQEGQAALL